jgi:hypothetical protein
MSNEEFDRKMAFIVEQQAQFASDIQRLQESQARTDQVVAQTGEIVTRLANVTHVGFTEVNAKINALVDSQIHTDENLRNLVVVVDRYLVKAIMATASRIRNAIQQPISCSGLAMRHRLRDTWSRSLATFGSRIL